MGAMSPIHWILIVIVVLVLFGGGGKISSLMGDFAKGIKSFKKGLADDEAKRIEGEQNVSPDGSVNMHQEQPQKSDVK